MSNIIQTKEVISSISKATQEQILKNLRYDRTIEATIHHVEDASLGKYRVKYQDAIFKAKSQSPNIKFYKGDYVLVQIPEGDFSSTNKTITGLVNRSASYYIENSSSSGLYNIIGCNLYKDKDVPIYLSSSAGTATIDFIDKLIGDDERKTYLQDATHLLFKFKLKTNVSQERGKGHYAIGLDLKFSKEVEIEEDVQDLDEEEAATTSASTTTTEEDEEEEYTSETRVEVVEFIESYYFEPLNVNGYSLYNMTVPTQQRLLFALPYYTDSRKFLGVAGAKAIIKDFIAGSGQSQDIQFSNIEFLALDEIPGTEAQNGYLTISTPEGTFFKREGNIATGKKLPLSLQAKFFLNGEEVNAEKQGLKFYWFKEDLDITENSDYYMKEAGSGWACLNTRTGKNKTTKENIFTPTTKNFQITEQVCFLSSRNIKCIVKTKDGKTAVSSKPITVRNQYAMLSLSITSTKGIKDTNKDNTYAIPKGTSTVLKCIIKNTVNNEYWSPSSDEYNIKYTWKYYDEGGTVHAVESDNKEKIEIDNIMQFRKYVCGVVIRPKGGTEEDYEEVGTAEIEIYEGTGKASGYSILIENDVQSFIYDGNGGAPDQPLPLKLKFFNNGILMENEEEIAAAIDEGEDRVLWKIPVKDTLLVSPSTEAKNKNGYHKLYRNFKNEFSFTIDDEYKLNYTKNQIIVQVKMKGTLITAKTSFSFVKQGAMGTNGTDESCWIEYKTKKGTFARAGEFLQIENRKDKEADEEAENKIIVQGSMDSGQWSTYGLEGGKTNLNIVSPKNNQTVIKYQSNLWLNDGALQPISNILKYTCSLGSYRCHYYLPIVIIKYLESTWKTSGNVALKKGTGFSSVMYSSDGKNPSYNREAPFELSIKRPSKDIKYKVDWVGYSSSQIDNVKYNFTITPDKKTTRKVKVVPPKLYNHYSQVFYLLATIRAANNASKIYARVLIPIYCYANSFFNTDINEWSGGSVQMNDESVLAPMVGAGFKNTDNEFTGVMIGTQKTGTNVETGLFAYGNGTRTVFVNAKTGRAEFGASGGKIIIAPGEEHSIIKSDNYSTSGEGSGMKIDLTEPGIKFGSGNFSVNEKGELTAKGGGKLAGWDISNKSLSGNSEKTGMCAAFHRYKAKDGDGTTNKESEAAKDKEGNYIYNDAAEVVKIDKGGKEPEEVAKAFWAGASSKEANGDNNTAKFVVSHDGFLKAEESTLGSGSNKIYIDCHSSKKAIYTGGEIGCKAIHADGKIRCKDLYFPVKTEVGKDKDGNPIYELVDTSLVSILNSLGANIAQSLD